MMAKLSRVAALATLAASLCQIASATQVEIVHEYVTIYQTSVCPCSPSLNALSAATAHTPPHTSTTSTASTTSAASTHSGANTILSPAIHWDHDLTDLSHLTPQDSAHLYYAEQAGVQDPTAESLFCHVTSNFTYPAVVLEHSAYIDTVVCAADASNPSLTDLTIHFTTAEAYNYAKSAWLHFSHLVILSFSAGCGVDDDQRTFWLTTTIQFIDSEMLCCAMVEEILIEDGTTGLDLIWGNYKPSSGSTPNPTTPGSTTWGMSSGPTSTSTASNSAATTSNGATCGTPPSNIIDGFPAAACGADFDEILDEALGYLNFDDEHFAASLEDFAPGLSDYDEGDIESHDDTVSGNSTMKVRRRKRAALRAHSLHKRFDLLGDVVKVIAAPVKAIFNDVIAPAAEAVGTVLKTGASYLGKALAEIGINPSVSASYDRTFSYSIGPKEIVDSPFGPAAQLYSYTDESMTSTSSTTGSLAVYCVGCGFNVNIEITGQASVGLNGIQSGSVGFSGNLHAGLSIGLDIGVAYEQLITKHIAEAGLPGFSIPKIITLGPIVSLDAEVYINAQAEGQIFAGVTVDLPNFAANLDLIDSSKSMAGGFEPQIAKTFNINGQISIACGVYLPLSLGVGISIPAYDFTKTIALIEKPGVVAQAQYSVDSDPSDDAYCANGLSYSLTVTNDVSLNFFGLASIDLFPYNPGPLIAGCIPTVQRRELNYHSLQGREPTVRNVQRRELAAHNVQRRELAYRDVTSSTTSSTSTTSTTSTSSTSSTTSTDTITTTDTTSSTSTATATATLTAVMNSTTSSNSTASFDATVANINSTIYDDFDQNADNANDATLFDEADAEADGYENETTDVDFTYVHIADDTLTYSLIADDNGNFYVDDYSNVATDSLFVEYAGVISSDDQDRIFHYYTETMTKYGVSRVRLSDMDTIPHGTCCLTFVPLDYDDNADTASVYVAISPSQGLLFPILCDLEGQYSKLFVVNDIDAGIDMLQNPDLIYTVTGGVVTSCYYLPLVPVPY